MSFNPIPSINNPIIKKWTNKVTWIWWVKGSGINSKILPQKQYAGEIKEYKNYNITTTDGKEKIVLTEDVTKIIKEHILVNWDKLDLYHKINFTDYFSWTKQSEVLKLIALHRSYSYLFEDFIVNKLNNLFEELEYSDEDDLSAYNELINRYKDKINLPNHEKMIKFFSQEVYWIYHLKDLQEIGANIYCEEFNSFFASEEFLDKLEDIVYDEVSETEALSAEDMMIDIVDIEDKFQVDLRRHKSTLEELNEESSEDWEPESYGSSSLSGKIEINSDQSIIDMFRSLELE